VIRPTGAGLGMAALGAMLYFASMQASTGLLFLVLGLLFACFVVNAVLCRRRTAGLRVTPPAELSGMEFATLSGTWEVHNDGKHRAGRLEVCSEWGPLLRVGLLGAGESCWRRSTLQLSRRGVYPLRDVRLRSAFPFGLVRSDLRLQAPGELVVHPRPFACEAPPASGFEPMFGGHFTGPFTSPAGHNFHGVRPMQPGDPVRLIHWQTSAKGQGMMVKEFDEELSGRVALLVDCRGGDGTAAQSRLDDAARTAASLALAALEQGHHVELATLQPGCPVTAVSPFMDSDVVLDALARLTPGPSTLRREDLAELLARLSPKASRCLILSRECDVLHALMAAELAASSRPVAVYLPEDQPPGPWPTGVRHWQYRGDRVLAAGPAPRTGGGGG
jgi:uncharacterized protein (DUF58 family)